MPRETREITRADIIPIAQYAKERAERRRALLPMNAAGWKENIRNPIARQSRITCVISPTLRGVTVMLWAR